ncbi:MAG: bacteriohemerythrin [Treponema sp.]|jgi:hemerythrin|nr:bacteriohemerythrin [Treponema sp.]
MPDELFVRWDDHYSVGIPAIDSQHKELLNLTNELYDACQLGDEAARSYFRDIIHKAVEYAKFHFSAEEQIMKRIKFPEIAEHKKEHRSFVRRVLADVESFESGKLFVPNTFVRFLKDWILTHVAMSDQKYHSYIIKLKKQGAIVT